MRRLLLWPAALLAAAGHFPSLRAAPAGGPRVVTLGTSVTEIVCRLGAGNAIAGMDQSSLMFKRECPGARELNYFRQLSSEGVLSLQPTLVLTTTEAGPAAALEQIRQSGVRLVVIPENHSWEGTAAKIKLISRELGCAEKGAALIQTMAGQKAAADAAVRAMQAKGITPPKVLFVMNQAGQGSLMCAGEGTGAQAMIAMAGGVNAVSGFSGYKAVSAEALVAAQPEIVLYSADTAHGFEGGAEALRQNAGLQSSPAARNRRMIGINMAATLGFGASLGTALQELAACFYPPAAPASAVVP